MTEMSFDAGDAIAVLALVFSGYATWRTLKFNERQESLISSQEALNKRLLDREDNEAREDRQADLGAAFIKLGSSSYRLKIFNKGKSAARNLSIEFPEGNDCLIESDVKSKFPMEVLEQHTSVERSAAIHRGAKSKHLITLKWSDDMHTHNQKTVYPTI